MSIFLPSLPRTLSAALRDARHDKPEVRLAALGDLERYARSLDERPQAIAALCEALADNAGRVRARAASALGEARASEAVNALLALVDDADSLARQMAIEALGAIGDPRAEDRIRAALFDARPEMRFQAVIAYPRVGSLDAAVVTSLVRATRDDDAGIRYIALRVLEERLGEPRAPQPLDPEVTGAARARLDDDATAVRVAAALLLARGGDVAGAHVLVSVVSGDLAAGEPDDEAAAVEAVGELAIAAAQAGLARRAFGAGRVFRERFALLARSSLARMGDERAKAALLRGLDGWSRATRTQHVAAVARAGLHEAIPLLEAMRGSPNRADPATVDAALEALGREARPAR